MVDFTTVLSGTTELDDSAVQEFDTQFLLSLEAQGVADQFASYRRKIGAEAITLRKYDHLSLDTAPLNEREDVDSEGMSDSKVLFTPVEHGKAVTTTEKADIVSGGIIDVVASRLVGENAGRTMDKLAIEAMDTSARIIRAGGYASTVEVTASDEMGSSLMEQCYNTLSRENVARLPQANNEYIMLAHDDVISSLRSASAVGSFLDITKYSDPSMALKNEIGMYKGFRVIQDDLSTIQIGAGAAGIDIYNSYFVGFNAYGKVVSRDLQQVIKQGADKLDRFLHFGWKTMVKYGLVEPKAMVKTETAAGALAKALP